MYVKPTLYSLAVQSQGMLNCRLGTVIDDAMQNLIYEVYGHVALPELIDTPFFNMEEFANDAKLVEHKFFRMIYSSTNSSGFDKLNEDQYSINFVVNCIFQDGFEDCWRAFQTSIWIQKALQDARLPNLSGGGDDSYYDWIDTFLLENSAEYVQMLISNVFKGTFEKMKETMKDEVSCGWIGSYEIYWHSGVEQVLTLMYLMFLRDFIENYNAEPKQANSDMPKLPSCGFCEVLDVSLQCNDCEKKYCSGCDVAIHRNPGRSHHIRNKITYEDLNTTKEIFLQMKSTRICDLCSSEMFPLYFTFDSLHSGDVHYCSCWFPEDKIKQYRSRQ